MKRRQWSFLRSTKVRIPLTKEEEQYWLHILEKILKVGIEFEFNLPEKKGVCSGYSGFCYCIHEENCGTLSSNYCNNCEICQQIGDCSICSARVDKKCSRRPKTKRCDDFELACSSKEHRLALIDKCSDFVSPCISCHEYKRPCSIDKCSLISKTKSPQEVRSELEDVLCPTNFVATTGKHGVLLVTRDGSLVSDGGVEIPTVGRRPHFSTIYKMCENIINECTKRGAYVNHRTSIHVHTLAGYLDKFPLDKADSGRTSPITISELEKPVPEVILSNFHQLVRRFQNALVWMSSAVRESDFPDSITRWGKFRQSLIPFSAMQTRMYSIIRDMKSNYKKVHGIGTNTFINYSLVKFDPSYNINTFHIEGRFLDGMLSSAAITALTILHYALVLKSVELSRFGILESFNPAELERAKEIKGALMNREETGWDSNRVSDNSNISSYIPMLQEDSKELIYLVKNTLERFYPSFEILMKLADKPVSMRLREHCAFSTDPQVWPIIEKELIGEPVSDKNRDLIRTELLEIIKTNTVIECSREDVWIEETLIILGENGSIKQEEKAIVLEVLNQLVAERKIFWSKSVGSYISNID